MRRAHRALYRGEESLRLFGAGGDHVEDFRGRAVLLRAARAVAGRSRRPRGQWFCQGRAAATADGIRGRGAEADLDLAGRQRRMSYPNTDIDKISVELSSEAKKYAEKAAALATDPYFREAVLKVSVPEFV